MTGLPTATVKFDDGTGTYAQDVTSKVLVSEGVTVNYGRTDELSQAQAATLSFVMDDSGAALGWDSGGWDLGPWDGTGLWPGQMVRFTETFGATTRNRFTGRVDSVDLGWAGGSGTNSQVRVTAVDAMADLSRRLMLSILEEEVLSDTPIAYYTLGEPSGAVEAADTSGNDKTPLLLAGSGTDVAFGVERKGAVRDLPAAQFFGAGNGNLAATLLSGAYIYHGTAATWTVEFFFIRKGSLAFTEALVTFLGGGEDLAIQLDATGTISATMFTTFNPSGDTVSSGTGFNDGDLHHVAVSFSLANDLNLYVDGVLVDTNALTPSFANDLTILQIGAQVITSLRFTGYMSHVAIYDYEMSAGRVAAHADALTGFEETTQNRLARIAGFRDAVTTSTTSGMAGQLMSDQVIRGGSLFAALQQVAAAEGGVLYVNGSGVLVLQGRNYRNLKVTPDVTIDSESISPDTGLTWDRQQLINRVQPSRTGSDTAIDDVYDITSIDLYGEFPTSLELAVPADADVIAAAEWLVASHKDSSIRLPSAVFALHQSPVAEQILARDIGDRLLLSPMPTQMWPGGGDVSLEGWSETLTHMSWTLTANLLPHALFSTTY